MQNQLGLRNVCIFLIVKGEMPEWSIGAVSKTVDQLAGPRVRIPVSPQEKSSVNQHCFFVFCNFNLELFLNEIVFTKDKDHNSFLM